MRLALIFAFFSFPVLAIAQTASDLDRLVTRCGSGECQNALSATLAQMNLDASTNDTLDQELALLAFALFDAARTAKDIETERRVASALYTLSEVSPDPVQAGLFTQVADAIMSGDTALYDTADPFAASAS